MVGVVDGDIVNVATVGDVLGVAEGTAVGASVGELVGMEARQSG